jgi:putative ABC transport system ATP-binding protein
VFNKEKDIIILKNVTMKYVEKKVILKDINLTIKRGEMLAVTGHSGTGKTTLLNILGGNLKKYDGNYYFQGSSVKDLPQKDFNRIIHRYIGYIMQKEDLFHNLSVYDNVKLPLIYNNDIKMNQIRSIVLSTLDKVSMQNYLNRKIRDLSLEERQMVALARSMINTPELVIADDPTKTFDVDTSKKIMQILKNFNRESGVTLIVATHDQVIADMCDRILMLKDGKIEIS